MNHEKRRFLPEIDFITSPGYLDGSPDARTEAGLPANTGPYRVITSLAAFDFSPETRRMRLISVREGMTADKVLTEMEFEPEVADSLDIIEPPRDAELEMLRSDIDPDRVIIGRP
jgi:acyl CoA:acetate/3-ketoacid CoA transferase beta subunit